MRNSENGPAKFNDSIQNLLRAFEHHNFFAAYESENGVRSFLDEFDEVGIDHQRVIVEAGELDHSGSNPWRIEVSRSGAAVKARFTDRAKTHWKMLIGQVRADFVRWMPAECDFSAAGWSKSLYVSAAPPTVGDDALQ